MADHPLVTRYLEARSTDAALAALGAVCGDDAARPALEPLADHYDDLASHFVEEDRPDAAAATQERAVELDPENATRVALLGWYALLAGDEEASARAFDRARALPSAAPGEVEMMEGMALDDVGRLDAALEALDRAAHAAEAGGADAEELGLILAERRDARERAGLAPDERDERAGELNDEPLELPVALPWFAPSTHDAVIARWPELREPLADDGYRAPVEDDARAIAQHAGRRPGLVAVDVERYVEWAAGEGLDPDDRASLEAYAEAEHRAGRSAPWPPGRNEPCWCGSGAKYKRCCGR